MNGITALIIGAFLVLFGITVEKWLVKRGVVRDKTYSVVIVAIVSVLMKQIWFYAISWWYFAPLTILAMVLGANRGDLWTTMNRGRWWWEQVQ
jgi:hypothetical protein